MSVTISELAWAAGFMEGEGYFGSAKLGCPVVSAVQVQKEPLQRLEKILGCGSIYWRQPKLKNAQPQHTWLAQGKYAAGVMMTLYSWLSPKRKTEVRKALDFWRSVRAAPIYQTHCRYGHPYTYSFKEGRRRCKPCHNDASRRYMARQKGAA